MDCVQVSGATGLIGTLDGTTAIEVTIAVVESVVIVTGVL